MYHSEFLEKAQESLRAARLLLENGCLNSTANRAYYAAFHAARASLIAAGESSAEQAWSHDALQAEFANRLINRRKVYPATLKDSLRRRIQWREVADYRKAMVSLRTAKDVVRIAEEFVSQVERRLEI